MVNINKHLLLILLLLISNMCHAFEWTKHTITSQGITIPYSKCVIVSGATTDKPYLVMYLHGGTSKGSDNEKQLLEPAIESIATYMQEHGISAIFLIPQCPADKSWGGPMNNVLKSLIDSYATTGVTDANRIYLFGGSMGGTGTWGMVSAYPNIFAAAMPVAGNPSKCVAANVAHVPVLTVMGTADNIMSIAAVNTFVDQVRALGGEVQFDIEEDWTHEKTCINSYTTSRLDWVFAHMRGTESAVNNVIGADEVVHTVWYTTDGNHLMQQPQHSGIYVQHTITKSGIVNIRKLMLR